MTAEYIRPETAMARFGVCRRTLERWAKDGLIGRSRVGGAVWLNAQNIADLIAAGEKPRTVVPIAIAPAASVAQEDPYVTDFWKGAV